MTVKFDARGSQDCNNLSPRAVRTGSSVRATEKPAAPLRLRWLLLLLYCRNSDQRSNSLQDLRPACLVMSTSYPAFHRPLPWDTQQFQFVIAHFLRSIICAKYFRGGLSKRCRCQTNSVDCVSLALVKKKTLLVVIVVLLCVGLFLWLRIVGASHSAPTPRRPRHATTLPPNRHSFMSHGVIFKCCTVPTKSVKVGI